LADAGLWHLTRRQGRLLADSALESAPIVVLGSRLPIVGGSIRTELERAEVERLLTDGFFRCAAPGDRPVAAPSSGLRELGLPYEADPAMTRHLAQFLALARKSQQQEGGSSWPTARS
jgi:hypothetical protein